MIPPVEPGRETSSGEREVFRRLRDDPITRGWTVLHSLDMAHHRRQVAGEADFVAVVPGKGVVCLEVKGASSVSRQDGQWFYGTSRQPDRRGPFRQASENMHSLRDALVERDRRLSRVVFWSAVVFPYVSFDKRSDEWHPWQVIDSRVFRGGSLGRAVEGVLDSARLLLKEKRVPWFDSSQQEPSAPQCGRIIELLRPQFEAFESPRSRAERLEQELKRYTEEQYEALEAMRANPRVLFEGPAGSGKTLLAIEACRRAERAGRKVLFLCFNRLLGRWLERETASLAPAVKCSTLHSFMMQVSGARPGPHDQTFWERALPERFIDCMLDGNNERQAFDELIVDEAQDMLSGTYLNALDLSVHGGLAAGTWRFFGDFEKQAIYNPEGHGGTPVLPRLSEVAPTFRLRSNCRNTPRIASVAELVGHLVPGYSRILRPDDGMEPALHYYTTDHEQQQLLSSSIRQLRDEGFRVSEVAILSPRSDTRCVAAGLQGTSLAPLAGAPSNNSIRFGSLHSFKGLEAPAVILTDVSAEEGLEISTLFYLGATRALQRLHVLAHSSAKGAITSALVAGLSSAYPLPRGRTTDDRAS